MKIEDKNYADKVSNWISKLEDFKDTLNLEESLHCFVVNFPPFEGLVVDVTEYEGKRVVLFYKKDSFLKIHYPKKLEYSNIKRERGGILCIKTEKYWAYDERTLPLLMKTVGFGMDMTMPFLAQQDWKTIE